MLIPSKYCFYSLALCLLAIATIASSTSTGGLRTMSSQQHGIEHDDTDRELQQQQQQQQQKQFGNPNQLLPKPTKRPIKKLTKRPTKRPTKKPTKRPTKKPVSNLLQQSELCTISAGCLAATNNNLNILLPGQACPTACIEVWDPVCDCLGRQHSNVCVAHSAGLSVVKRVNPNTGEC